MLHPQITIVSFLLGGTSAFTALSSRSNLNFLRAETSTTETPFFLKEDELSIYDRIGVDEDDLGLGIDPEEVLKWIGTRDDLEAKILEDNPKFERSRVVEEASKLYVDAEVLNLMIKFNEKMSDPEYAAAYEKMKNANRNVAFTYAGYIGGGLGLSVLNKKFVQPKLESGEWTLPWASSGVEADVLSQNSNMVDNIASTSDISVEAVQSTMDTIDNVVSTVVQQ